VLGAALAAAVLPGLREVTPTVIPRLSEVRFDVWAVAFTAVLILVVTLVVGIVPASRASRNEHRVSGMGWRGRARDARGVQMALAFVLIAATSLAMRAVGRSQ
jgi:hypothetical protein